MNPLKKKHRDDKSLLQGAQILLTLAVAIGVLFSSAPTADGFIAFDHRTREEFIGKRNNLIRRVHKDQWVIGYAYADPEWGEPAGVCPPEARHNGAAIEAVITDALRAWLLPVKDLNTGKPVVDDFRYVPNFDVSNVPEFKLYDLRIVFFCDFGKSHALTKADEAHPPQIKMHQGTNVTPLFAFAILHEIGHSFGLLDTYPRRIPGEEFQVSRGGLKGTIGHQPASIMSGLNRPVPLPTRISQDDANGIVWLYKFYHENLPLEDCIFPDYELETSPDGCRPKHPLIFEIKHGSEKLALQVLRDDETIDVGAKDETGSIALFWAAKRGYYDLTNRLLRPKDMDIRDAAGTAALKEAIKQGHTDIVDLFMQWGGDWTSVDRTSPAHQRAVFYLHVALPAAERQMVFHAGYLGTILGGDALFVTQKRNGVSIEKYLDRDDISLVGYQGVVAAAINIREVASFPGVDGEMGSVLLAVRDVDLTAYQPLELATFSHLTETDIEVLTYKFGSGILLEGKAKDKALNLPLQVRPCISAPHVGLGAKGLWQHTCGPSNSVASGSLLFDKEKRTLIGFYREQDVKEILGNGLPLADVVSEALIRLVDAKPVSPKNRLTTTWAALKAIQ